MNQKDICIICGEQLEYAHSQKEYTELRCEFCQNTFSTHTYCPNGHFVCDTCHSEKPIKIIEEFCRATKIKDPFAIADKIMKHPNFNMYGPEHHALSPASILTALKNNDIKKPNGESLTFSDIEEGIHRGAKIPGGYCGFYGSCGAGIGAGIAISVFTGANPSKDIPRSLANKMTSRALIKIADDLEHCCKRSVRISICEALDFLNENFGIKLQYSPNKCLFSSSNKKCEASNCPIFLIED
ncbi:MAG: hypothetical protein BAJALOKI1v1_1490009 [Promethearchaeota archaeon]|nr:MAG: hypothetical protein BAJALOKI1v1_1490009 [Candidatus Lokiarchaeota archaeon]